METQIPQSTNEIESEKAGETMSLAQRIRDAIKTLPHKTGEWLLKMGGSMQTLAEHNPYIILANGGRKTRNRYDENLER